MECPWCHEEVEIRGGRCPECKQPLYEVTDRDFDEVATHDHSIPYNDDELDVVELIIDLDAPSVAVKHVSRRK